MERRLRPSLNESQSGGAWDIVWPGAIRGRFDRYGVVLDRQNGIGRMRSLGNQMIEYVSLNREFDGGPNSQLQEGDLIIAVYCLI